MAYVELFLIVFGINFYMGKWYHFSWDFFLPWFQDVGMGETSNFKLQTSAVAPLHFCVANWCFVLRCG